MSAFSWSVLTGPRRVTAPSIVMIFMFLAEVESRVVFDNRAADFLRHFEVRRFVRLIHRRKSFMSAIALVDGAVVRAWIRISLREACTDRKKK